VFYIEQSPAETKMGVRAGAYGASMSSNYNTRPLIAEVMVQDGQARVIRRKQTVAELIALETAQARITARRASTSGAISAGCVTSADFSAVWAMDGGGCAPSSRMAATAICCA
jgi:hypothetical protein